MIPVKEIAASPTVKLPKTLYSEIPRKYRNKPVSVATIIEIIVLIPCCLFFHRRCPITGTHAAKNEPIKK